MGVPFRLSLATLGGLWGDLGGLWGVMGTVWGDLGGLWDALGGFLGCLWVPLGFPLAPLWEALDGFGPLFGTFVFLQENHIFRWHAWPSGGQNGCKRGLWRPKWKQDE